MSSAPSCRFSTGEIMSLEEAKAFTWEAPVPVEPFWDSFKYCTARNFLDNFSDAELAAVPIPHDKADGHREKVELLLALLRAQLAKEEEAASPPQSLYETNHNRWYKLWQAIYVMEDEIDLPSAEQTVRMLVERRPDKNNVVPPHMLADYLVKTGRYKEAEDTERPVCAWMDARPKLGKESPQAINARRIIARALWFQGPSRRAEAEALLAEIKAIVDGMGDGKFGVYQSEERSLNDEMLAELAGGA